MWVLLIYWVMAYLAAGNWMFEMNYSNRFPTHFSMNRHGRITMFQLNNVEQGNCRQAIINLALHCDHRKCIIFIFVLLYSFEENFIHLYIFHARLLIFISFNGVRLNDMDNEKSRIYNSKVNIIMRYFTLNYNRWWSLIILNNIYILINL